MGGRGSSFLKTSGRTNEDWFKDYDYETYTNKPTASTDFLKDIKNTWVMSTTDVINRPVMNKQSDFIKTLASDYSGSIQLLDESNNLHIRALTLKSSSTYAAFVFPRSDYKKMQICFNLKKINQPEDVLKNNTKTQIDSGYWSYSDDNNLVNHTVAHEYGHFVERTIIEKKAKKVPIEQRELTYNFEEYYHKKSKEIYDEIYKIKCSNYGDNSKQRISRYAQDSYQENFAEIFANLTTSKHPTNWAKAMDTYLKQEGIKC